MIRLFLSIAFFAVSTPLWAVELTSVSVNAEGMESWLLSQPVNHDSTQSPRFQQRLFISTKYSAGPHSPVILETNGELPFPDHFSAATVALAKKNKAIMVGIEHRYYGDSLPFKTLNAENLKSLNTHEVLGDIKSAIETLKIKKGFTGPWVAVGCSYGGTIATYLQATEPGLILGTVAFSSPIKAETFWSGQDRFISSRMSPTCLQATQTHLKNLESSIAVMDEKSLNEIHQRLQITTSKDKASLLEIINESVRTFAQQGQLQTYCEVVDANDESGFLDLVQWAIETYSVAENSFTLAKTEFNTWYYQACSEYGFFGVGQNAGGFTSASLNADHYLKFCNHHFGTSQLPDPTVLNKMYYEKVLTTDNILFLNQADDAWADLSIRPDNISNAKQKAVIYSEGEHCSVMDKDFTAGEATTDAAREVLKTVADWLK